MGKNLTSKALFCICFFFVFGLVLSGSAQADVSVEVLGTDITTHGDWRETYGQCFYVIPDSTQTWVEVPFTGDNNVCYGGLLLDRGLLDWDIFMDPASQPPLAFIWYFNPTVSGTRTRPVGGVFIGNQWNPCIGANGAFRGATFDNDISPTNDPLASEMEVDFTGSLTVAYYFLEEEVVCRTLNYELFVNGVSKATGSICNFDTGKYLVFRIHGLEGTSTIKLAVINNSSGVLTACCQGQIAPPQIAGVNVHLSGVFVDDCLQGCTPGYWKQEQHFDSWPSPYTTGMAFESVFSSCSVPGTPTLLDALWTGGGGLKALMRHAVAALLNSASPSVFYKYETPGDVISMVNAACSSGNYEATKCNLARANEEGCPLN